MTHGIAPDGTYTMNYRREHYYTQKLNLREYLRNLLLTGGTLFHMIYKQLLTGLSILDSNKQLLVGFALGNNNSNDGQSRICRRFSALPIAGSGDIRDVY